MRRVLVLVVVLGALGLAAVVAATRRGYGDTHGSRVVHYTLESRALGRGLDEVAVVPRGGSRRRPLLVLLHGRHDPGALSWLNGRSGPESLLSDALFAGLARLGARAPVVVLVNGGGHSYFHDRRDGAWGSMLLNEAIPDARERFATTRRVAIGGISMGGYGALHAVARGPRRFCAVGGHSAALWQHAGDSAPGAFDDAKDFERHDVFAAARRGAYDDLPVWIDGGDRDPFRAADAAFVSLLRARGANVSYHVWPGGHDGAYWHAHMAAYLRFYADALARC